MTDTPRTDSQTKSADRYGDRDVVPATLARELETELTASKRLVVEKCGTCKHWQMLDLKNTLGTIFTRKWCEKIRASLYIHEAGERLVFTDEGFCCCYWDER